MCLDPLVFARRLRTWTWLVAAEASGVSWIAAVSASHHHRGPIALGRERPGVEALLAGERYGAVGIARRLNSPVVPTTISDSVAEQEIQ